ncbi:axoneme-associated protein mst101(2)-like [Papilio machaon]|uniref:axoneme-associated protein mst101(2)-like n=1 Tax=Papilio machaon TaxID=76193 RepID=UPI001E6637BC|nr:axoneme-associated protein mst101(2)-like [Papilio machaon]
MDGDIGTVHGIRNVSYILENEKRTFKSIHFNRNKCKYREKRRSPMNEANENTDYITTTDRFSESPDIDRKANITSQEYTKCSRRKRRLRKTSVDLKPLKRMMSSCSFVGKSKIKGISISPGNVTLINKIVSSDENVRSRGDNEVKVLYKRDFRRKENAKQIISPRRSRIQNIKTDNSQTSLFGFQRCIQRKRHLNYNLSVFYKLLQGDAKDHNVLRCKHYSFEDLELDKPKKKSSFVKSQNDAPAHYNLVNFTQHSSISNVYLLKPKYYKKLQCLRKNKSPFRSSNLDKRKSILKKDEDLNITDVQPLKTKNKEPNVDTEDNLTSKPLYKGITGVNICKPAARISNTCSPSKISTGRKSSKKSVELFDFLHVAMKYLLFIMTLIIWFPCILVLGLGWLISYPCRPHKESGSSKCTRTKRRKSIKKKKKKKKDKPPQKTKKEKKCNKFENKKKDKASIKKKTPAISNSKKRKGIAKKCPKTCSDCTQYTVTPTGFFVPESTTTVAMFPNEEIGSCIGKKRQKNVSFKQPCGRTSETYLKINKNKVCSGCRDKNEQSIDICGDTNQEEQDLDQKSDLNSQCQAIVVKSCKGKRNRRNVEVCVPKSLSKLIQSALRGTCSTTNQFANVRKLPKIKSCNSTAAACLAFKKKRKCLSRQSKYIMRNLKKNLEASRSSVTRCLPSPCPGGCASKQAAGGGDSKKRKKIKHSRKQRKSRKPKTVMKFLPPPPPKSCSVGSNISFLQPTPKTKSLPRLRRCNRMTCDRQPLKVVSVSKMYAPVRPEVRTISSNTMMLQTSSFFKSLKNKCSKKREKRISIKKFITGPCPKNRHVCSNTRLQKPKKKPRKSTTVVKFFPVPRQRLVHSSVNTRKLKLPSCKKVKSKSSSACLSSSNKVINFSPEPCSSTIACSTCEIILPIEPLQKQPKQQNKKKTAPPKDDCNAVGLMLEGRKSYDKRHSQEMLAKKPARVCKFFPAPRYSTRTLAVGACIKNEIKLPTKSSKSTSFPQKTLFRSLSVTTGTNTCSAAPTQIIKFIKTHKSIMHRGTVPQKLKGDIFSKTDLNLKKHAEKSKNLKKPVKRGTKPGTHPCIPRTKHGTTPGKKPGTKQGMNESHEGESLKKHSTGFSTRPVRTRSRKVMLQTAYPIIRFQPRSQAVTCTRGVNTRKTEWCFISGYRRFQQKRKIRKAANEQRKILICKKSAKSPGTSQSFWSSPRSLTGSPTPSSSRSALQAKQRAERAKQLAKEQLEKAKGKSKAETLAKQKRKERAKEIAKQKAKQRAEAQAKQKAKRRALAATGAKNKERDKAQQAKQKAKERAKALAKQKAKNRAKALKVRDKKRKAKTKKKGKKAFKKNAGKVFKKLTPPADNLCSD